MQTTPPTPPAGPGRLRDDDGRLLRGERSRVRIRAAAQALFRERGFDGATLRAIAERLLEAADRGLWAAPDEADLELLRDAYLEVEGELEEAGT